MLGNYFYHEIIRKTVIAFGTLFNDIHVRHEDQAGNELSDIKVPVAYGPRQKFLARIQQQPELNKATQITLPRMSFEVSTIDYDASRKSGITQTFKAQDGKKFKKVFMPVPYNLGFELNIMTKTQDDALQIVEQILPFFQPGFTLTVDLVKSIGEKRDVPLILNNISYQDDYEGNFETRRALIYTLSFTAKTYMFGPVTSATKDIIKKVKTTYISGDSKSVTRDISYTVTPRATKNYTGDVLTNITEDIGLADVIIPVVDGSKIPAISSSTKLYINIGSEELFVKAVDGNNLTVERGQDQTVAASHLKGAEVKSITTADNALIEEGDDFGFDGSTEGFL